jgi:hypothetical protein
VVGLCGEIGSLGIFLRKASSLQAIFGLTAAHCVPGAFVGSAVRSPSVLEVMSRLEWLLGLTSLCSLNNRSHLNLQKEKTMLSIGFFFLGTTVRTVVMGLGIFRH